MKIIYSLLLCICFNSLFATAPFQHYFGGSNTDVAKKILSTDNGWVVIGSTSSYGNAQSNVLVVFFDSTGSLIQQKVIASAISNEVTDAIRNYSGDIFITVIGSSDGNVIKLNSQGDFLWQRHYGLTNCTEQFNSIYLCDDGNLLMAGKACSSGSLLRFYLVKADQNGNEIWTNYYNTSYSSEAFCLVGDGTSGYFAGGNIMQQDSSGFLIHIDNSGNLLSSNKYNLGYANYGALNSGVKTMSGDFCFTGKGSYGSWGTKYLLKIDINGNVIFNKNLGGGANPKYALQIVETIDSNLITIGYKMGVVSSPEISKFDMNGNEIWSRMNIENNHLPYSNYYGFGSSIVLNSDQTFTYCGTSNITQNIDGIIVKTDENGFSTPMNSVPITADRLNFCDSSSVNTVLHAPAGYSEIEWRIYKNGVTSSVGVSGSDTLLVTEAAIYYCLVSNGDVRFFSEALTVSVAPIDSTILNLTIESKNTCRPVSLSAGNIRGYIYEWTKDGVIINSNESIIYNCTTGIYTLRIYNECGSFTTPPAYINTQAGPPHQTLSEPDSGYCSIGTNSTYLYSSPTFSGDLYTYFFLFRNDTLIRTEDFNPYLVINSPGVYKMVTLNNCGSDTTNELIVSGNVGPKKAHLVEQSVGTLRTHYSSIGLSYTGLFGVKAENYFRDSTNFQWYKDGILIGASNNDYYTFQSPGEVYFVASNACGSAISDTFLVEALPFNDSVTINPSARCNGRWIVAPASASSSGIQWYRNGTLLVNETNELFSATDSGSYYCTFSISGSSTQFYSDTIYFPTQSEYNTVLYVTGLSKCQGDTVELYTRSPASTYQWYIDGLLIPGATSRYYDAISTGNYYCEITNTGCSEILGGANVSIGSPLIEASRRYICSGQSVRLYTIYYGILSDFHWYKDTISNVIDTTNDVMVSDPGIYWFSVNSPCGIIVSDTIQISNASIVQGLDPSDTTTLCKDEGLLLSVPYSSDWIYSWKRDLQEVSDSSDYLLKRANWATTSQVTQKISLEVRSVSEGCVLNSSYRYFRFTETGIKDIYSEDPLNSCGILNRTLVARSDSGFTRQWFFNGDSIPGAVNAFFSTVVTGNYHAVSINEIGCPYESNNIEIRNDVAYGSISTVTQLSICNSIPIQLELSPAFSNCQWYKDGIIIPGATSVGITAESAGLYTVKFDNATGCFGESSITVAEPLVPNYFATPGDSRVVCQGDSVYLYFGLSLPLSVPRQWLRNGVPISGANDYYYYANSTGAYSMQIEMGGCTLIVDTIDILVSAPPIAIITSAFNSICGGDSLLLSCSTVIGSNYQWNKNGLPISGAEDSYYYVSQTGNYSCGITSPCGNAVSNTLTIGSTVNVTCSLALAGSDTLCNGNTAPLSVVSNGSNFKWYRDGMLIPGANGSTFNADQTGLYTCTAFNLCSALSSSSIFVYFEDLPSGILNSISQNIVCDNDTLVLNVSAFNTNQIQWKKNGIPISGATSADLEVYDAGFYYCELVNSCGTSMTDTIEIVLSNIITVAPDPISGSDTICPGLAGNIYNTNAVVGADWYNWNADYGIDIVNGQQTVTVETFFDPSFLNGELYVQAGNSCGFGPVTSLFVIGDTSCMVDGLNEMFDSENSLSLLVYPNPSASSFKYLINSKNSTTECQVRLIDLQGRLLIEQGNIKVASEYEIGSNLSFGIYELQIIQKDLLTRARLVKVN